MARLRVFLPLFLLVAALAYTQNPPQSDPQALSLAAQSIAAMTGGTAISDVSLTGNVTWIAGSDTETGPAILMAKGTAESRLDLNLSGGTRTDIRNDTAGYPQGASVGNDGTQQPWALHNCWISASWFFPALSALSATTDPTLVFSYVGPEIYNGVSVYHIQSFRYLADTKHPESSALTQVLSTTDSYLDATSLLPVAVTFNSHPDDDAATNIAVEIDFTSYQALNGLQVPFHIQKLVSGGLALDIAITGAVFDSGLPDSLFALQ